MKNKKNKLIESELKDLNQRLKKAKKIEDEAYNAFKNVFETYFPERVIEGPDKEKYRMRDEYLVADIALAKALYEYIGNEYDYSVFPLPFEWLLASYVTLVFKETIPKLMKIKSYIELHKHSERKPFDWNDIDNYCCCLKPKDGRDALLFTAQSYKFLAIFEYAADNTVSKIHLRELSTRKPKYFGPRTLRFYKHNSFRVEYGDCRDHGYIITWEKPFMSLKELEIYPKRIDRPEINLSLLKAAVFDIECLVNEIEGTQIK